jgi:hypothetical protein
MQLNLINNLIFNELMLVVVYPSHLIIYLISIILFILILISQVMNFLLPELIVKIIYVLMTMYLLIFMVKVYIMDDH